MFVLKTDLAWVVSHANRNTDERGTDRWACKTSGARIMAREVSVQVEDVDGKPQQDVLVRLQCPKCGESPPQLPRGKLLEVIPHVEVIPITLVS